MTAGSAAPVTHLALVGPTASGKSALALAAAEALGDVEIVSVDSMQVYRGMDIGTAKPTADEQAAVPHHLLDLAGPGEEFSVARFQALAAEAIAGIESRGRRALLVGGTGLYYQAIVDGFDLPGEDRDLRAALYQRAEGPDGAAELLAELAERDPVAAGRIEPGNTRRIVRALEVTIATGRPFSSFGPGVFSGTGAPPRPSRLRVVAAGIWLSRALVAERVEARIAAMVGDGLVDEVRRLAASPGGLSRTAREGIGYKEVLDHLEGSVPTLEAALRRTAERTRQLARRQRMWFRRDRRIAWIGTGGNPLATLPALLATWTGP
ncbi:MAG TPA: tRNA (adenosine(37)-N6)-dimethylallyltransferase MiaA [Acidimicrobiia bacterium]|nr:tRNA (adenosine(37)-N6)-dimethylallyltransferase MiaA [Acidimicrobiia bacterium]